MTSRLLLPWAASLTLLASPVYGAAYSANFDAFDPTSELAGQDGWTINDTTPNLSFFASIPSQAAALGAFFDAPALTNVELTHAYGLSLSGSSFDVDLVVAPSTIDFPGRDSFGFSFRDGANALLMSVILRPNPAVADQLEVLFQGPTGAPISTGSDILDEAVYHLSIDFAPSGADATFNATLIPGVGPSLVWNGTLTGAGAATLATFGADFDVAAAAPGDNFLAFDNIAMVPEPGSALLLGLGLLAAAGRRRRR